VALRWPELAAAAKRGGADWAGQMAAVQSSVSPIADLARSAGFRSCEEVMSHGDIDQKNLLCTPAGPVLCDWDVAMPVVPRRELADVAMSLAGWQDFSIAREVVRAYRASGGDDAEVTAAGLGPAMMTGLDWVAFNAERALGPAAV
jgi:aminoglycoside phosphotransferase (APT) family kinase protein